MKLIDTHCHISKESYGDQIEEVIANTKEELEFVINIGTDIESSKESRKLAEAHDNIYFTAGVHPNDCIDFKDNMIEELKSILSSERAVALGEIGLDYYRDCVPMKKQKAAFEAQIELARQLKLPVVIHGREAYEDIFNILALNDDIIFILHSYAGTYEQLPDSLSNIYVSFSGIVTFKNAKEVQRCASMMPINRLLVETDAPFLAPQPMRGKKNYPSYVKHVAEKIAKLRNMDYDEVVRITNLNSKAAFNILR